MIANVGRERASGPVEPLVRGALVAEVRCHGVRRMTPPEIAAYRRRQEPLPPGWPTPEAGVLRQSDEQTVVALAAAFEAIRRLDPDAASEVASWGLLVAPRFLGREKLSQALTRFDEEGVWGVSPHLIPHFALHSPSGTLSLALGIRGPNLGIGGGAGSAFEGLLAALSWLDAGIVPAVLLAITGWHPERIPGGAESSAEGSACEALALVLAPSGSSPAPAATLRIRDAEGGTQGTSPDHAELGRILGRGPSSASLGIRIVAHRPHGPGIPRPHHGRDTGGPERGSWQVILADASGRMIAELGFPTGRVEDPEASS
ncbi:hypothetical protein [Aquisphaera insulae]|uniref:hypothetical protein n=1 Tax=Aquisphaera insulae TaxID=2712864 RepID=UPI0013EC46B8|nr:hypothetical protein [Aquisphaera insulae]